MTKTFRDALMDRLDATGMPLKEVAERAGVSYEQLKKVKQRADASTNVDDARQVANAFGLTLDEFLDDRTIEDRIEVVNLYNQLSPTERRFLKAASAKSDDPSLPQE